ncbi:hypothetical protein EV182_006246, partial [Spiromyces aspiralis]
MAHRVPFCCKELSYTDCPSLFNHQDVRSPDVEGFHEYLSDVLDDLLWRFPEIDEDIRKKVEKEEAKKEVGKKADEEVDKKTKTANRIRLLSDLKAELDEKRELMETDITTCTGILKSLVQFLNAYHGRKCILLIDEFDMPIVDASKDNRNTIKSHICDMLRPVVKPGTERLLSKCIMVGVNPINLSELGFGVNNFTAPSLHSASQGHDTDNSLESDDMLYQITFGFTEDEVRRLIATHVFPGRDKEEMVDIALNVARSWYGGYYVFRDFRVYNPWAVMRFIEALAEDKTCSNEAEVLAKAKTYWIKTGSAKILKEMYYKIIRINPSISRVLFWMGLDYFNLKGSIEPSALQTSVRVELIDSFGEKCITQKTTP